MDYKHFQGPGFSIQIPTDWFVTSSLQFQAMFVSPPMPDGTRPSLAVSIRRIQPGIAVGDIAEEAREVQAREYSYYEILSEHDTTQDGGAAFQRLYQWYNQDEDRLILQQQTLILVGENLYTLTASRAVTEEPWGLALDDVFLHMIGSFRLELVARESEEKQ